MNTENILFSYLLNNINKFSAITLTVIEVNDITELTNDPGNEELYLALISPVDDDKVYKPSELVIDYLALNKAIQDLDIANGDHSLTINAPIIMNSTILLPISMLS